jgi:hypothetical protein
MSVGTFNVMFFDYEDTLHTYYFVEDEKVEFMGDRVDEKELPQRLEAMRRLGVQSVYVFVCQRKPGSVYEWMHADLGYKQAISTAYAELKPPDSLQGWLQQTKRLMAAHEAEFAELSITAVRE